MESPLTLAQRLQCNLTIPVLARSGLGKLELKQTRNGHYFSSGTVNGTPVVFMIDTGATTVSISSEIAARTGIQKCAPRRVSTANGQVNACLATVPEVTFSDHSGLPMLT